MRWIEGWCFCGVIEWMCPLDWCLLLILRLDTPSEPAVVGEEAADELACLGQARGFEEEWFILSLAPVNNLIPDARLRTR